MQVAAQPADVVDANLVADRLEHVEIRVRPPLDTRVLAEQLGGEEQREVALADAGRAVQEICVRRSLRERGGEEALGLVLLGDGFERHRRSGSTLDQTSAETSATSRAVPSSSAVETIRQPSCRASWRYTSRVALLWPASDSWMSASSVV